MNHIRDNWFGRSLDISKYGEYSVISHYNTTRILILIQVEEHKYLNTNYFEFFQELESPNKANSHFGNSVAMVTIIDM